ncbi:unnamed protein product [Leuciscus chuanchicus]
MMREYIKLLEGSVHDSRVLRNSVIYEKAERGLLFPNTTEEIQAHHAVGGSSLPTSVLANEGVPGNWESDRTPESF